VYTIDRKGQEIWQLAIVNERDSLLLFYLLNYLLAIHPGVTSPM
jgi:hypothetical protein